MTSKRETLRKISYVNGNSEIISALERSISLFSLLRHFEVRMISIFAFYTNLLLIQYFQRRHSYFSRSSHGIKRVFARDDYDTKKKETFCVKAE